MPPRRFMISAARSDAAAGGDAPSVAKIGELHCLNSARASTSSISPRPNFLHSLSCSTMSSLPSIPGAPLVMISLNQPASQPASHRRRLTYPAISQDDTSVQDHLQINRRIDLDAAAINGRDLYLIRMLAPPSKLTSNSCNAIMQVQP